MIPIKNKKKTLEVTVEEMTNFALNYVEKFAPSKQQLRTYLLKKYLTSRTPNIKNGTTDVTSKLQILDCGKIIKISQKGITPIFNHK